MRRHRLISIVSVTRDMKGTGAIGGEISVWVHLVYTAGVKVGTRATPVFVIQVLQVSLVTGDQDYYGT